MNNKKLFTTLAALTVGAVVSTGTVFTPAIALANDHEKHDGDKSCKGEQGCSGEHEEGEEHHDEHK